MRANVSGTLRDKSRHALWDFSKSWGSKWPENRDTVIKRWRGGPRSKQSPPARLRRRFPPLFNREAEQPKFANPDSCERSQAVRWGTIPTGVCRARSSAGGRRAFNPDEILFERGKAAVARSRVDDPVHRCISADTQSRYAHGYFHRQDFHLLDKRARFAALPLHSCRAGRMPATEGVVQ
jgi:hypothetical protein